MTCRTLSPASTMGSLFEDRIREKREMILRVRGGSLLTEVPPGEVDDAVDVPIVPTDLFVRDDVPRRSADTDGTHAASLLEARSMGAKPRARVLVVAILAASVVLGGAVFATMRELRPPAAAPRDVPSASSPSSAESSVALAPVSSTVAFHVESQPTGARVVVAGRERGVTPLDLTVPRGEDALDVELRTRGFVPRVEVLKPNVDQRVFVTLAPSVAPAPARPPSRTRPSAPPTAVQTVAPSVPPPNPTPAASAPADPFQKFN